MKTYRISAGATTAQVSASSGVPVSQIEEVEAGTRVVPWPVVEDLLDACAVLLMREKGLAS